MSGRIVEGSTLADWGAHAILAFLPARGQSCLGRAHLRWANKRRKREGTAVSGRTLER